MATKSKLFQLSNNGNQIELQRMYENKVTHINTRTTYPIIEYVRKLRTFGDKFIYQVDCVTSNDELIIKGTSTDGKFWFTLADLPWIDRKKNGYCEQLVEDKRIYTELCKTPEMIYNYL